MRLSNHAIKIILDSIDAVLGEDVAVWLFGSRIDDTLLGGDIDLFIEVERKLENRVAVACQIGAKIQMALGEQRIDVIVKDSDTAHQPIHDIAKSQGIQLC